MSLLKPRTIEEALEAELRDMRRDIAVRECKNPSDIFTKAQLDQLVLDKPLGLEELLRIPGFDHDKVERYGVQIVKCIQKTLDEFYPDPK